MSALYEFLTGRAKGSRLLLSLVVLLTVAVAAIFTDIDMTYSLKIDAPNGARYNIESDGTILIDGQDLGVPVMVDEQPSGDLLYPGQGQVWPAAQVFPDASQHPGIEEGPDGELIITPSLFDTSLSSFTYLFADESSYPLLTPRFGSDVTSLRVEAIFGVVNSGDSLVPVTPGSGFFFGFGEPNQSDPALPPNAYTQVGLARLGFVDLSSVMTSVGQGFAFTSPGTATLAPDSASNFLTLRNTIETHRVATDRVSHHKYSHVDKQHASTNLSLQSWEYGPNPLEVYDFLNADVVNGRPYLMITGDPNWPVDYKLVLHACAFR